MKPNRELIPEFVELAPPLLEDGVIYISMIYGSAVHKCCCGCGGKVVTPFSPTDWKLIFDGESVSLEPSIGNWSFACKSHYFITRNRVVWAPRWSQEQIDAGRAHDRFIKEKYFGTAGHTPGQLAQDNLDNSKVKKPLWRKIIGWFS